MKSWILSRSPESVWQDQQEELMQRLAQIELCTVRIAGHSPIGDYRSRLRGQGLEFVEHKKYVSGDDYRHIDWNVLARTRQAYVKLRHEEKEMSAVIVVDFSGSMEPGIARGRKWQVLMEAAATLAFSALSANMSVGLVAGAERVELYYPPRKKRGQAWRLLRGLLQHTPESRGTRLENLLSFTAEKLKRPALLLVISDFILEEGFWKGPRLLNMVRRHDLVPIFIEDPLERRVPTLGGYVRLKDLETGDSSVWSLNQPTCRRLNTYLSERHAAVRSAFLRLGIIPVSLKAGEPPVHALMEFFLRRKKQHR